MFRTGIVHGVPPHSESRGPEFPAGMLGKARTARIPKRRSTEPTPGLLTLLLKTLCGPIETETIGGAQILILFIKDHSGLISIYLLGYKLDAMACYPDFGKMTERQTGRLIQAVQSDRGGDYQSAEMEDNKASSEIDWQVTTAYFPQRNGMAERKNCTLWDWVRSMLRKKNLTK